MSDKLTKMSALAASGSCPECGAFLAPRMTGVPLRAMAPPSVVAALVAAHSLTPRERAVFRLLGFGYDNRSIARELRISERTVKRNVTGVLAKLKLESRLQAGLAALILSSSSAADVRWPEGAAEVRWPEGAVDPVRGRE